MARGQLGPWCTEPDGQAGGQGWPWWEKEMGRKASRVSGQSGANLERGQISEKSLPMHKHPHLSLSMQQLLPTREACFSSVVALALDLPHSHPLHPQPSNPSTSRLKQRSHLCSSSEAPAPLQP